MFLNLLYVFAISIICVEMSKPKTLFAPNSLKFINWQIDNSSFKLAYIKEDGSIGFTTHEEHEKSTMFIAVGSAITSYARNFTIRHAQKNYKYFIYADTDSIHCDLKPEEIVGIKVHDKNLCCWKLESCWDEAIFTRQKTYI